MIGKKANIRNQQGFIAIVALGIFLILGVVGIIVQATTSRTTEQVRDTVSYREAQDLADSVTEHLQMVLEQTGSGFILQPSAEDGEGGGQEAGWDCELEQNSSQGGDPDDASMAAAKNVDGVCSAFSSINEQKSDVKINMQIKGRSEANETFGGGFNANLGEQIYVVPFPGTGNAGKNCELYEPDFTLAGTDPDPNNDDEGVNENNNPLDHKKILNHPCNWNKLSFGSSSTDRAAIPLYYTDVDNDGGVVVHNSFSSYENNGNIVPNFLLRVRTPCEPERKCTAPDTQYEQCEEGEKIEIPRFSCPKNERYSLDTFDGGDKAVLQWQISGECGYEECGLIPLEGVSDIKESYINDDNLFNNNIVLIAKTKAKDTSNYGEVYILPKPPFENNPKLPQVNMPTFSLMLTEHLISMVEGNKERVPYLEYQLLSNVPVGNPQVQIHVTVDVDGHIFEKDIYVEEEKELIDFAIHN